MTHAIDGWPTVTRLDAPHLLDRIADITGVRLTLEGPCPGGEAGAAYVRWPDGRRSVLTAGESRTGPLLDRARAAGVPTARHELSARIDGVRAIVQQRLPGVPPAEAELIQNLLLEEGVPSLVRRSGGADVPDFLASGWRDILVPSSGADAARELLGDRRPPGFALHSRRPPWMRALAATLAVVVLVFAAAAVLAPLY